VVENLRNLEHAPSVQMSRNVAPDIIKFDFDDENDDPDVRMSGDFFCFLSLCLCVYTLQSKIPILSRCLMMATEIWNFDNAKDSKFKKHK